MQKTTRKATEGNQVRDTRKAKKTSNKEAREAAEDSQQEKLEYALAMLAALYWSSEDITSISKNKELRHFGKVIKEFSARAIAKIKDESELNIENLLMKEREQMNAFESDIGHGRVLN